MRASSVTENGDAYSTLNTSGPVGLRDRLDAAEYTSSEGERDWTFRHVFNEDATDVVTDHVFQVGTMITGHVEKRYSGGATGTRFDRT